MLWENHNASNIHNYTLQTWEMMRMPNNPWPHSLGAYTPHARSRGGGAVWPPEPGQRSAFTRLKTGVMRGMWGGWRGVASQRVASAEPGGDEARALSFMECPPSAASAGPPRPPRGTDPRRSWRCACRCRAPCCPWPGSPGARPSSGRHAPGRNMRTECACHSGRCGCRRGRR